MPGDGGGDQRLMMLAKEVGLALGYGHGGVNRPKPLPRLLDEDVLLSERRQRDADRLDLRHVDRFVRRAHRQPPEQLRAHRAEAEEKEARPQPRPARPRREVLARRHRLGHDRGEPDGRGSRENDCSRRVKLGGGVRQPESRLIASFVSSTNSIRSPLICATSPVVIHGIVGFSHHSGLSRLGV